MSPKLWDEPSESYLTYPETVAANRSGQITDIQRSILWSNIRTSLAGALFGLPLLGLGYIVAMRPEPANQRAAGVAAILGLAFLIFMVWLLYTVAVRPIADALNTLRDLLDGHVTRTEGVVAWVERKYEIRCAGLRLKPLVEISIFRAEELDAQNLLRAGRYRFYFLPRSGIRMGG